MAFMVDGVQVQTVAVPATSFENYETEVQIDAGVREIGVAFLNDYYDEAAGRGSQPHRRGLQRRWPARRDAGGQPAAQSHHGVRPGRLTTKAAASEIIETGFGQSRLATCP